MAAILFSSHPAFVTNTLYHDYMLSSFKQGKCEGFDSCDRPSNLRLDSNRRLFSLCDFEWITSKNNMALLLCYVKLYASFQIHRWISNWSNSPETLNSGQNWRYRIPCDLEIWWMTLKNDRAHLLYYIKLCASFEIHRWSQTWVTVRKRSIWVKIGNFLSGLTLKFDGWQWKTIGNIYLFQALCIIL